MILLECDNFLKRLVYFYWEVIFRETRRDTETDFPSSGSLSKWEK